MSENNVLRSTRFGASDNPVAVALPSRDALVEGYVAANVYVDECLAKAGDMRLSAEERENARHEHKAASRVASAYQREVDRYGLAAEACERYQKALLVKRGKGRRRGASADLQVMHEARARVEDARAAYRTRPDIVTASLVTDSLRAADGSWLGLTPQTTDSPLPSEEERKARLAREEAAAADRRKLLEEHRLQATNAPVAADSALSTASIQKDVVGRFQRTGAVYRDYSPVSPSSVIRNAVEGGMLNLLQTVSNSLYVHWASGGSLLGDFTPRPFGSVPREILGQARAHRPYGARAARRQAGERRSRRI